MVQVDTYIDTEKALKNDPERIVLAPGLNPDEQLAQLAAIRKKKQADKNTVKQWKLN